MQSEKYDIERITINGIEFTIPDLDMENEITGSGIQNILLLNMSTLQIREGRVSSTKYRSEEDTSFAYEGYGQLEPIPVMLAHRDELDLVIITASEKAAEVVSFTFGDDKAVASPVSFFKYRIRQEIKRPIQFLTIMIDKNEKALLETTNAIRAIRKEARENLCIQMDVHGGPRELQLLFDGIMQALAVEGIQISKAFTCNFDGVTRTSEIKDVTEHLHIFQLVSGINEFVNYGYGYGLERYLERLSSVEDSSSVWCQNLVMQIRRISESLTLCQVDEFEKALKSMTELLNQDIPDNVMLQIFRNTIEVEYGDLLESATLYREVEWARKKHFLQQCLTLVEAKTAKWIFEKLLDLENTEITRNDRAFLEASEVAAFWNSKKSYEQADVHLAPLHFMHYSLENKGTSGLMLTEDGEKIRFIYGARDKGGIYDIRIGRRRRFEMNAFIAFIGAWGKLKKRRNDMFHMGQRNNKLTTQLIEQEIDDYLAKLKKLEDSIIVKQEKTSSDIFTAEVLVDKTNRKGNRSVWLKVEGEFLYSPENIERPMGAETAHGRLYEPPQRIKEGDRIRVRYRHKKSYNEPIFEYLGQL